MKCNFPKNELFMSYRRFKKGAKKSLFGKKCAKKPDFFYKKHLFQITDYSETVHF